MTNNLGRNDVTANQEQKTVTIAESDGFLDAAITAQLDVTVTDTNAATITQLQLRRNNTFNILPGSPVPTAAITVTIDTAFQRGNFTVVNETAQSVTVTIAAQTATAPVIAAGGTVVCNLDGADVRPAGGTGGGGGISGIDLEDEGVAVTGTPHTRFNFTGAGVTVTNVDGTEATINVPGGGSGIELEDEGVAVTGTPHTRLNFAGAGVTVADVDGAEATVTIPGGGSGVSLEDEGVAVTGTPHSTLNFTGTGVTVTDVDGTEATVSIPGGGSGVELEDEGVAVTGTPHARLNFTGAGVTVADVDGTEATVTIPGGGGSQGVLWVEEQQANNVNAGDPASADVYDTRNLNTVRKNTITGASVASNVITLPAGTYRIFARAPGHDCALHKCRLQNTTDATTTIFGTGEDVPTDGSVSSTSILQGEFTIVASKNFELQHRLEVRPGTGRGFGRATGFGEPEVYSSVFIEKVG